MTTISPFEMRKQNSLNRLRELLDPEFFVQLAEETLESIDDPELLANYAHLLSEREHGGIYYQAVFWSRVLELIADGQTVNDNLAQFFKRQRLSKREIVKLNELGKALSQLEQDGNPSPLRLASNSILTAACRQNGSMNSYIRHASQLLSANPNLSPRQIHADWCSKNGSIKSNLDIIKPSDWWAFSHPKWRREEDFAGSIPGEIYANALYYFAPRKGIAVDAMAGSGMLKRVYDDKDLWQKDSGFRLKIHLFDINPRRRFIKKHDARNPLPLLVDWIFLDPPYFGQSGHLFDSELSKTQNLNTYKRIMEEVVAAMSNSLNPNGRICILVPKWSGKKSVDTNSDIPRLICTAAEKNGLKWIDAAYVSRGRQQEQGSALKNISAKRERRMRSDTCVLNVFEKGGR